MFFLNEVFFNNIKDIMCLYGMNGAHGCKIDPVFFSSGSSGLYIIILSSYQE